MFTIFATCKPFEGPVADVQRNAITSWTLLQPKPDVILLGDDKGTMETALDLGCYFLPDVECTRQGTPLVSSLFELAQAESAYELLCYINADIIVMQEFADALSQVAFRFEQFLMIGQRWDVPISGPLDFSGGWQDRLRARLSSEGRLHPVSGVDYFAFRRGLYADFPPFAVGRCGWDNALVISALAQGVPVVDATQVVQPVHQGLAVPTSKGEEWKANRELWGWPYLRARARNGRPTASSTSPIAVNVAVDGRASSETPLGG